MILVFHGLYDSVYAIACQGAKVGIFSVIPRAQHEEVFPLFNPEHHLVDLRKILQQLFSVIARCASFSRRMALSRSRSL